MKFSNRSLTLLTLSCFTAIASLNADAAPQQSMEEEDVNLFRKEDSITFVSADFLYWTVNEGALDFALKMHSPAWSLTNDTLGVGHYQNAEFNWSPGVRVTLGYFRAPHYWDMYGQYTYFSTNGRKTVEAPSQSDHFLDGTYQQPDPFAATPNPLSEARSQIEFSYQTFDALVSRRFYPNPHLRLNVFGGLATGLIFQKWKVHYLDNMDQQSKLRQMWKFEGLGLRLGGKVDWYMGWDLYLTGQGSAGILSGWYERSAYQNTNATVIGSNNSIPFRNTHYHDKRLAYTAQLLAGPSWQKAYDAFRIEVIAAYELTIWNNIHEVVRTGGSAPGGSKPTFINTSNVTLQGYTFRVNFDF